jgi:hypothetical protein
MEFQSTTEHDFSLTGDEKRYCCSFISRTGTPIDDAGKVPTSRLSSAIQ